MGSDHSGVGARRGVGGEAGQLAEQVQVRLVGHVGRHEELGFLFRGKWKPGL